MSSLIISRIILTAFLAVSLSACSKGGGNSKASVARKGGGQQKNEQNLDLNAAKGAAQEKAGSEKATADSAQATSTDSKEKEADDESNESTKTDKKDDSTVTTTVISVTPATPKKVEPKVATHAAPSTAKSAPAVKSAPEVKRDVVNKPKTEVAKTSAKKEESKVSDKRSETKTPSKSAQQTKVADKKATDKKVEDKKSEDKSKIDAEIVARDVARREIVVKTEADLDKDDSSKENLGAAAYKTLVEKLLSNSKVDSSQSYTSIFGDEVYFTATKAKISALPQSLFSQIHSSSTCAIDSNRACLLIEVALDGKVTGSYIGFKIVPQAANPEMMESRYFKTFITDVAAQKDLEILSRISGGKTVLFVTSK